MVTPELRAYVKAQLAAGVAEKDIRAALAGIGWDAVSIQEALGEVASSPTAPAQVTQPATQPTATTQKQTTATQSPTQQASTVGTVQTSTQQPMASVQKPTIEPAGPTTHTEPVKAATASRPHSGMTIKPTLRALTAIDSQFRAGVDKETIRTLLLGVGWEPHAIDEAFLAVEWEENLLSPGAKEDATADTAAPKLSTIDTALAGASTTPTKKTLIAIDTLLRGGVSKGDIRTLLLGVGWEAHAIDQAFLAVEWRENSIGSTSAAPSSANTVAAPHSAKPAEPQARPVESTTREHSDEPKQPAEAIRQSAPVQPSVAEQPAPQQTPHASSPTEPPFAVVHPETPKNSPFIQPVNIPTQQQMAPRQSSVIPSITITPATSVPAATFTAPTKSRAKLTTRTILLAALFFLVVVGALYLYFVYLRAH